LEPSGIDPVDNEAYEQMDDALSRGEIGAETRERFPGIHGAGDEEIGGYTDELTRSGFARRQVVWVELLC